jgi:hypothetical protein
MSAPFGYLRADLEERHQPATARAVGVPGSPKLAFWRAAIDGVRMVSMHHWSIGSLIVT